MRILQNITIKYKLILIIMLTCITGMVLAGATLIIRGWSTFRNDMVRSLSTQAEMIAENCKASLAFQDAKDAEKTLQALHVEPTIVFGGVYLKDNKLFATYYRDYADVQVHPTKFRKDGFVFEEGLLTIFRPIVLEGEIIGTVCLRSDLSPMYAVLKHNIGVIIVVLFLSSLVAFFVSSRLQTVISKPILSLAKVAKAVSEEKDYSTRAVKHSNDEVGLLIDAFNEMLGQIQQRNVELVDAKEKLEVRVEERTVELKTTNEQLTQEVVVRQKAEEALKKRTDQAILYRDILLRLAKIKKDDLASSLETITEEDSRALRVERVGIWFFDDKRIEIVCEELYKQSKNIHERGLNLKAKDYPKYFQSLDESRIIAASDARTDYRTNEFTKGYLEPTGITSMMDVPLWLHGRIVGVIRHGHTGPERTWTTEEQDFAASIADMVSLTLEASERKKAEEMTKRLNNDLESTIAKLDRANGELKNFVYIASHDLREPLRKISAFGELLSTSLKDKLNDDEKENFGFMVDGAKRMQQMIDALLAYSRVATKGVDFEAVDLNKVVEELREVELAVKIEESGAKILVPEQLHTVSSDPAQVRQLMQNLVANGLKYQKKGAVPQITISSSAADNDMVRVEVTDNGIGIKQEYFKNLFIMFRRLHSRQEYEGSGIGLAVCKKIVERHGGNIGVSSTCGEGSTFWFTMLAQKPSEEK